jgi:hypothetical protein
VRYPTRQILFGAVMVVSGLLLSHCFGNPLIVIHGPRPEHVSSHGLNYKIGVLGAVLWVTIGGVIMVIGLILRAVDPNWRPHRRL